MSWEAEYREKLREFLAKEGTPVRLQRDPDETYDPNNSYYTTPGWRDDMAVSVYGWVDDQARDHVKPWDKDATPCRWIVPEGAQLTEVAYSEFVDTFTSNRYEVGVNVYPAHCNCGKFERVVLRWDGSLKEILHSILGLDGGTVSL